MNNYFTIENGDKIIEHSHEKKLKSIANRISKANEELLKLGYTSYLCANGGWNIMNGSSHNVHQEPARENIVASFSLDGIDVGDW